MRIESRLRECGYDGDAEVFRQIVLDTYRTQFGSMSPDELLLHPSGGALPLVNRVCELLGTTLPEDLVLRTLLTARKRGQLPGTN
jgi:hypothetical protein